ncbi:MAG: hypothetical protein ACTSVI_16545 [Promethearchaeota archaeon]
MEPTKKNDPFSREFFFYVILGIGNLIIGLMLINTGSIIAWGFTFIGIAFLLILLTFIPAFLKEKNEGISMADRSGSGKRDDAHEPD